MIRYVEKQDRQACIEMMKEFYASDAVVYRAKDENFETTFDLCMNNSPYVKTMVCVIDGEYAGYANLSITYTNELGGLSVFIEEIYVRPPFQGQGLGTGFISFIRNEFDDKVRRYDLEVCDSNQQAIKLYKNLGFEYIDYRQMGLEVK